MESEICIIGGGPAGLTVASRLADLGVAVTLVEGGSARPPAGGANIEGARSVGFPYPIPQTRARGLGGSALRWNIETPLGAPFVRLREFDAIDFEERAAASLPGWPLDKRDLAPFYREAWAVFGLDPEDRQEEEIDWGVVSRRFSFGPAATFTSRLPERLAAHPGVTLLTDTVVTNIQTAQRPDLVSALICRSASGESFPIRAKAYVIAAGGIENARLLLASRDTHPQGLGNGSDCVGRYFMEHPHYHAGVFLPAGQERDASIRAAQLHDDDGRVVQENYGASNALLREEGLLNAAFFLVPRKIVRRRDGSANVEATMAIYDLQEALAWRVAPPRPLWHAARLARIAPAVAGHAIRGGSRERAYALYVMAEQAPSRDSRIRLADGLDSFGLPKVELDWRVSESDLASMRRSFERVAAALHARFGGELRSLLGGDALPLTGGCHHMGATRMSAKAEDGVVDPDCRVHGMHNLFVAGSSVFPTGGFANPTLTIVALALRLAEKVGREFSPSSAERAAPGADASPGG